MITVCPFHYFIILNSLRSIFGYYERSVGGKFRASTRVHFTQTVREITTGKRLLSYSWQTDEIVRVWWLLTLRAKLRNEMWENLITTSITVTFAERTSQQPFRYLSRSGVLIHDRFKIT